MRNFEWKSLGIVWKIHWDEKNELYYFASEICAAIQLLTGLLAEKDLHLIQTSVVINCIKGNDESYSFLSQKSNNGRKWNVVINPDKNESKMIEEVRACMMAGIWLGGLIIIFGGFLDDRKSLDPIKQVILNVRL